MDLVLEYFFKTFGAVVGFVVASIISIGMATMIAGIFESKEGK